MASAVTVVFKAPREPRKLRTASLPFVASRRCSLFVASPVMIFKCSALGWSLTVLGRASRPLRTRTTTAYPLSSALTTAWAPMGLVAPRTVICMMISETAVTKRQCSLKHRCVSSTVSGFVTRCAAAADHVAITTLKLQQLNFIP